jgi:hypothetical protein
LNQVVGHQGDKRVAHTDTVFFENLFVFDSIYVLIEIFADLVGLEQDFSDDQFNDHKTAD